MNHCLPMENVQKRVFFNTPSDSLPESACESPTGLPDLFPDLRLCLPYIHKLQGPRNRSVLLITDFQRREKMGGFDRWGIGFANLGLPLSCFFATEMSPEPF